MKPFEDYSRQDLESIRLTFVVSWARAVAIAMQNYKHTAYGPVITPVEGGWRCNVTTKADRELIATSDDLCVAICEVALQLYDAYDTSGQSECGAV